jgi:hypothetical protein
MINQLFCSWRQPNTSTDMFQEFDTCLTLQCRELLGHGGRREVKGGCGFRQCPLSRQLVQHLQVFEIQHERLLTIL